MTLHVITDYKVAANPVAKAIARAKVTKALLHAKLQVYSLDHGAECRGLLTEIGMVLAVIGQAGELDPKVGPHDSGVRIIRGGLRCGGPCRRWCSLRRCIIRRAICCWCCRCGASCWHRWCGRHVTRASTVPGSR